MIKTHGAFSGRVTTTEAPYKLVKREPVLLKRTFNQKTYNQDLKVTGVIKFWRVIGPSTHKNYQSDLSLDGLKEWGIIQ